MNGRRRIAVFTGTRADYGLLVPLMRGIAASNRLELRLIVSGAHLSISHGETWHEIEADGFAIDERVPIPLESDTREAIGAATGAAVTGVSGALARLQPNAIVILGDRYEALAAAVAATIQRVPIVHLHGGELTLGAVDELFRHAITKLAQLHFTSAEPYRQRVMQMGEDPARVINAGALGVVNALEVPRRDRPAILDRLGLQSGDRYFLVTFHPATAEGADPAAQLGTLLAALDDFPAVKLVFTGANADAGGRSINTLVGDYLSGNPDRARFFDSLGRQWYVNAAREADVVIGNSSSGIIEVPSLGVPTVDIGTRQGGRLAAESVLRVPVDRNAIATAVRTALSAEFRALVQRARNPYERADTVGTMVRTLETTDFASLQSKPFFDIHQ